MRPNSASWWLLVVAAALAPSCSAESPRPASLERIDRRLLDQLDQAEVRLGPLPPEGAAPRERTLLERTAAQPLGAPWVALDGRGRAPRSSPTASGLVLAESACAIVDAGPRQNLLLHAEMAEGQRFPGHPEQQRISGRPVLVELDQRPPSAAEGCRADYLIRHGLMLRQPDPRALDGSPLRSFDLSLDTMTQTRAVAVVLATSLVLTFGVFTQVAEQPEATAQLGALRLARSGVEGSSRAQLRQQAPPDPLLPADPHQLRLKPSLERHQRDGVLAPPGTSLCWTLAVPERASLRFALGVDWDLSVTPGRPVDFRVRLGDRLLHEERRGPSQRGWVERLVPLDGTGGQQRLCLETEAEQGPGAIWSLWGAPELTTLAARSQDALPDTIVLVSIDTLRADRLGLYGYDAPTSPVLDRLAEEAAVFEDHVAQTGWTLPSHVSMLTGLTPETHGVTGQMDHILELLESGIDPTVPTLAGALRRAGYSTHAIVSAPYLDPTFGFDRGFDSYDSSSVSSHLQSDRDVTAPRLAKLSRRLLARSGRRPLFLFLHVWDVHYDYIPPLEDLAAVHPDRGRQRIDYALTRHPFTRHIDPSLVHLVTSAARPGQSPPEFYRNVRRLLPSFPRVRDFMELLSDLYDGEVRTVDRHLGMVLDELRRQGRDDAVIVVTGDHGEAFMEHGTLGHGVDNIFHEGLGVPLLIRAPGLVEPGRRHSPSMTIDISATILDLIGQPPLPGAQGRSVLAPNARERLVVGHDGLFDRVQATLGSKRLLVWGAFGPDQLFDLTQDPEELVDLGEDQGALRAQLRRELARYLLTHGRGLHAAVIGDDHPGGVELTLSADVALRPAFVYGPPGTGELTAAADGRTLRLRAAPGRGELVALTVLAPDQAALRWSATAEGQPLPAERVSVGRQGSPTSATADQTWLLATEELPPELGDHPGQVHLWRTPAFAARAPLAVQEETFEQLRALGYLRDRPDRAPADASPPGSAPDDARPAPGDR